MVDMYRLKLEWHGKHGTLEFEFVEILGSETFKWSFDGVSWCLNTGNLRS